MSTQGDRGRSDFDRLKGQSPPGPEPTGTERVRRSRHRGTGWQVRFQVLGEPHFRYFADRRFGSTEAALSAAIAYASHDLELHRELLALHRRLAPRSTSRSGLPGVSRYERTAGRGAHWLAYYDDPISGRRKSKRFPISMHGEQVARQLAMEWRAIAVAAQLDRYLRLRRDLCPGPGGGDQITSL